MGNTREEKDLQKQKTSRSKIDQVVDMRLEILCTQGSSMASLALVVELIIDGTAKWVLASGGQLSPVGLSRRVGVTTWKVLPSVSNS